MQKNNLKIIYRHRKVFLRSIYTRDINERKENDGNSSDCPSFINSLLTNKCIILSNR